MLNNFFKAVFFTKRRVAIFSVIILLAAFAAIAVLSYPDANSTDPATVPIIRADAGSFKTIPSDPGGMEIPHRDSTVFETLRTARTEAGMAPIENLLPGPEEPLSRDQLFAGLKTEIETEIESDVKTAIETPAETSVAALVPKQNVKEAAPRPAEKPAETKTSAVPTTDIDEAETSKVAATEPAAGKADDYFVQLGSFRSEPDAKSGWSSFQTRFSGTLDDLSLRVQKAELGEKGTYYRVQAGPVEEAMARTICKQIEEKQPGGCLVVRH